MAEGIGATGDKRFQEVLDSCLSALRRGDGLETCLNRYPGLADHLRPLLIAAAQMDAQAVPVPSSSPGGAAARERFLRAVTAAREAGAASPAAAANPRADRSAHTAPAATTEPTQSLPVTEALDRAVASVLAGTGTQNVAPELTALLQPLVALSTRIHADAVAPPAAPPAAMRTRFVTLAAALATLPMADVAAEPAADAAESVELETFARRLAAAAVPVPAGQLLPGRDRMLAAAAAAVSGPNADGAPAAPERRGLFSSPRARNFRDAFKSPARPFGARLAASAAVIAAVLLGNAFVLAPAAAASLPGEALYPVKRLGERVSLAVTLDPAARSELRAEFSQRRAAELTAAAAEGATGSIEDWEARFIDARKFEDAGQGDDLGQFRVLSRSERTAITTTLAWNANTNLDLGKEITDLTQVTAGSEVRLWVRLRGSERVALAARVRLVAMAAPAPTPTAIVPTETAVASTPDASATPVDTATPPVVPTIRTVTATATSADTATPPATSAGQTQEAPSVLLSGILRSDPKEPVWQVDELDAVPAGRAVAVDVAYIIEKGKVPEGLRNGHRVNLRGEWSDDAHSSFVAYRLEEYNPNGCVRGDVLGTVAAYEAGVALSLEDQTRYMVRPDIAPNIRGQITVGASVRVTYEDCGTVRFLLELEVIPDQPPVLAQGIVAEVDGQRLVLRATTGVAADPLTVRIVPGQTEIDGTLEVGQTVEVEGIVIEPGVMRADRITILAPAPTATTAAEPPTPAGGGLLRPVVTPPPGLQPPATSQLRQDAGRTPVAARNDASSPGSRSNGGALTSVV